MASDSGVSIFGKDVAQANVADYRPNDAYTKQGDKRVIKHLMFPWMVETQNPMYPDGPSVLEERVGNRGDEVTVEEIGLHALEKGERLGSFFTDEELDKYRR